MSTRNIVPRNNNEGSLGLNDRRWSEGHFQGNLKRGGYQTAVEFLNLPSIYHAFSLTRNEAGKVTRVEYYNSNEDLIGSANITYNQIGSPVTITDGTKTITLTYDGAGDVIGGTVS
jgi:YD repeat-containing protein